MKKHKTISLLGLLAVMFVSMGPASSGCPSCRTNFAAGAATNEAVKEYPDKERSMVKQGDPLGWKFIAEQVLVNILFVR